MKQQLYGVVLLTIVAPFAVFAQQEFGDHEAWSVRALTYSGLAASALGLAAWILWNVAQRNNKLDTRLIAWMTENVKPYQEAMAQSKALLDEERAEKRLAQQEAHRLNAELVKTVLDINIKHEEALAAVRTEAREQRERDEAKNQASLDRAHKRIDECEKGHRMDSEALAAVKAELRDVQSRLFQIAQATPPSTQPFQPAMALVPTKPPATAPA